MFFIRRLSDQVPDLWQQLELASELESDLGDTGLGQEVALLISVLEKLDLSSNTGAIDVKMDGSVLEEKSSYKMLGLSFSSNLNWGSYIISIAKTTSKKIGALIRSIKFLFPEVALHLYKSTI